MRFPPRIQNAAACLLTSVELACIRAPDVVMVDRKTVLEEQASGELHPLENDLREAAIVPKGVDFTRAQLEQSGADLSQDALSTIVQIHGLLQTEAEFLDDLLVRRCVGEARTGLLVETPRTCAGRTNSARTTAAVERVNRARRQLFRYLQEQRPGASEEEVRTLWRRHHLESVVCGGQVQSAQAEWELKRC
jgi:uncharacterized protein YdbL (DUF1318 family)